MRKIIKWQCGICKKEYNSTIEAEKCELECGICRCKITDVVVLNEETVFSRNGKFITRTIMGVKEKAICTITTGFDGECNIEYKTKLIPIRYCPLCGKKL